VLQIWSVKMKKNFYLFFVVLLVVTAPGTAAQWEIALGAGFNIPSLSNIYNPNYSPVFQFQNSAVTEASQVLNLEGKNSPGLFLAVNHLFNPHFGIQAAAEFHSTTLRGTGNQYHFHLEYTATYPPGFTPTAETVDGNALLPDTDGQINQFTLGLNLLTRFNVGRHLDVDLSGGISYFHLQGEASTLGYSLYGLGVNSTLFAEFFKLGFTIEPASRIGMNIGGTLHIKLAKTLGLFMACRYFSGTKTPAGVTLNKILNLRELISISTLEEIAAQMNLPPIYINPSFLSFSGGVELSF
jgi:hypothetical protein